MKESVVAVEVELPDEPCAFWDGRRCPYPSLCQRTMCFHLQQEGESQ